MFRRIQLFAVAVPAVFLFFNFAWSQTSTFYSGQVGAPQYNDTARYVLKGTVVNSVTGDPIPHALVQLMAANQRSVLAGSDGSFEIPDVPATRTWVMARKPGYFNQQEMGRSVSRPQWVQIGPNAEPVTIKLVPEAVIFGRVEDAEGEPVEGAQIQLTSMQVMNGRKMLQQVQGGRTNEDGEFRIASLRPGMYYVSAGATGNRASFAMAQRGVGYPVAWFYPGVADQQAATPVRITPGQRMEISFTLPVQPVFRISGRISGYPPGRGVNVQLMAGDQGTPFSQRFDPATGRFEIAGAPAGNYRLHAMTQGAPGENMVADVPLAVAGPMSDVRVTLAPETVIPVEVRTDFTGPRYLPENAGGGRVGSAPRFGAQQVSVQLRSSDLRERTIFSTNMSSSAVPYEMGQSIRGVLPGTYTAEFTPHGPWYVASALCGTTDLLREPLVVTAGQQAPPIEVVLRDDVGTLNGNLRANGEDGVYSVLAYAEGAATPPRLANFGSMGNFQFTLAPGEYKLLAFDNVDGLEYMDADAMKEYMAKAVPVTLTAGGKSTVTLDVIRRGE